MKKVPTLKAYFTIMFILIIISGLSSYLLYEYILKGYGPLPFWIETPSVITIAQILVLYAFEKWMWKFKIITLLTKVPNLNGRWEGEIQSSYKNKKYPAIIEIKQTFSTLTFYQYTENSSSKNINYGFNLEENGQVTLHYEYQNDPYAISHKSLRKHIGAAKLTLEMDKNSKCLYGEYYNSSRDRGRYGSMDFTYKSNIIKKSFN